MANKTERTLGWKVKSKIQSFELIDLEIKFKPTTQNNWTRLKTLFRSFFDLSRFFLDGVCPDWWRRIDSSLIDEWVNITSNWEKENVERTETTTAAKKLERRETRTLLNFISFESRMSFFQTKSQPWKPWRDTTDDKSGSQAPYKQMLFLGSQCGLSYFHFVQWDRTARNQTPDQRSLIECCDQNEPVRLLE